MKNLQYDGEMVELFERVNSCRSNDELDALIGDLSQEDVNFLLDNKEELIESMFVWPQLYDALECGFEE